MNFIYLSPHFPPNYYLFCVHLQRLGVNVFGLADEPYELLKQDLKDALTEYYKVNNMHNYDELLRACGFLTFKYGKIDRIDSQIEYWQVSAFCGWMCRLDTKSSGGSNRVYAARMRSHRMPDNVCMKMSNLERLSHLTFENFNTSGNPKAEFVSPQEVANLHDTFNTAETFAKELKGWLLLEGSYGCGKTHLAAAIANACVQRGVPTLFITVPDLFDSLRFAYNDPETTFEARFEDIRGANLLVMDDFGTQNATPWAQEKLFQIINYRYINKLPTVITTNLILDEIESRIRSRLQDSDFVKYIRISAPDYRRPKETSNPGISMLSLSHIKEMSFGNFDTRDDEVGKEIVTTITRERQGQYGRTVKDKEIVREKVTQQQLFLLHLEEFPNVLMNLLLVMLL